MLHRDLLDAMDKIGASPFSSQASDCVATFIREQPIILKDGSKLTAEVVLLIWRCVAAVRGEVASDASIGEFVATLPVGLPVGARPTNLVVPEMLESATASVAIMGYSFTSGSGIVDDLAAAAMRGARITIVCDRQSESLGKIRSVWPSFAPSPEFLVNAESEDALAKMHSKLLIVDDADLLITSANFTFHGFFGNIEYGVRLRGAASARAAKDFLQHLLETRGLVSA